MTFGKFKFTLIELIITITIFLVLIALLLPALSVVKLKANRTKCNSNIRQYVMTQILYAKDNDGYLINGERRPLGLNDSMLRWPLESYDFMVEEYGISDLLCRNGHAGGVLDYNVVYGPQTGYMYFGNHGDLQKMLPDYQLPKKITHTFNSVLFSDAITRSTTWKFTWVPHVRSKHRVNDGGLIPLKEISRVEGGNFGFLDGSVQWVDVKHLEEFRVIENTVINETIFGLFPPAGF